VERIGAKQRRRGSRKTGGFCEGNKILEKQAAPRRSLNILPQFAL